MNSMVCGGLLIGVQIASGLKTYAGVLTVGYRLFILRVGRSDDLLILLWVNSKGMESL